MKKSLYLVIALSCLSINHIGAFDFSFSSSNKKEEDRAITGLNVRIKELNVSQEKKDAFTSKSLEIKSLLEKNGYLSYSDTSKILEDIVTNILPKPDQDKETYFLGCSILLQNILSPAIKKMPLEKEDAFNPPKEKALFYLTKMFYEELGLIKVLQFDQLYTLQESFIESIQEQDFSKEITVTLPEIIFQRMKQICHTIKNKGLFLGTPNSADFIFDHFGATAFSFYLERTVDLVYKIYPFAQIATMLMKENLIKLLQETSQNINSEKISSLSWEINKAIQNQNFEKLAEDFNEYNDKNTYRALAILSETTEYLAKEYFKLSLNILEGPEKALYQSL